jgi:hypothetical protein
MEVKYLLGAGLIVCAYIKSLPPSPTRIKPGPVKFGNAKTTDSTPLIVHAYSEYITTPLNQSMLLNPALSLRMRHSDTARADIQNFCPEMLVPFDRLQHQSFKSDIWRVCVLHAMGKCSVMLGCRSC